MIRMQNQSLSAKIHMKNTSAALIGIGMGFLMYFPLPMHASNVYFSGPISSNTTWTSDNTYYLTDLVTVNSNIKLTVDSGTVVKLAQNVSLLVSGMLDVQGESGNEVVFTASSSAPAAGYWNYIRVDSGASATLTHAIVRYGSAYGMGNVYNNGGTLTISNSELSNTNYHGVNHGSGTTTITNSSLHDNHMGVNCDSGSGTLVMTGNTFADNSNNAAYLNLDYGLALSSSGNSSTGTTGNGIYLIGSPTVNQTWMGDTLAYVIPYYLTVPSGKTLTIKAGATIKLESSSSLMVSGTMDVQGTSTNPVVFTSVKDDTVGGNVVTTDGNPAAGNWNYIRIDSGASATLTHAIVRYGGAYWMGTLYTNGGTLAVSDSEINANTYGFNQGSGVSRISGSSIHNNSYGVYATAGSLDLTNNTFYDNSSADASVDPAVTYTHSGNAVVAPSAITSDLTWDTDYIRIIDSPVTINSGATLTINPGVIVKFASATSYLAVSGDLEALGTPTSYIHFTSYKDDSSEAGGDTNGDGGATSATSGDWNTIAFDPNSVGHLNRVDIKYGGRSGSYAHAAMYNDGGDVTVGSSTIAFSQDIGFYNISGTSTLVNTELHDTARAIYVTGGSVDISDSWMHGNSLYGFSNNTTQYMDAINNNWNATSGPFNVTSNPNGQGDAISDYVNYDPWLGQEHYVEMSDDYTAVHDRLIRWADGATPTKYIAEWSASVTAWNALDRITIVPATSTVDLTVTDLTSSENWWPGAYNYITKEVIFNRPVLDAAGVTDLMRQNTALHELGHALSLLHSYIGNVMYYAISLVTTLGRQDSWDYHYRWPN